MYETTTTTMRTKLPRKRLTFSTVITCMALVTFIYVVISFTAANDQQTLAQDAIFRKTKPLVKINRDFFDGPDVYSFIEEKNRLDDNIQIIEDHLKSKREQSVKETINNEEKPKTEVTHVAFLKVHKTASSTAQNVFLRFGDTRNLSFILAHTKGESGWLNVISYRNSITNTNIVPPPAGRHFDILCNHVIYNRNAFAEVLPKDTAYIGIVREPLSRFQSAIKYFSPNFILKLPGPTPLLQYSKNPLQYEPVSPVGSQTNNRMAVEFGFPEQLFPGKSLNGSQSEIQMYINKLDEEFKFIIISERFDESMVLMKRLLNWQTKDVLYVDKNIAVKTTNTRKLIPEEAKDDIRRFLYLDSALYSFAMNRFNRQVAEHGVDFGREVEHFKSVRGEVVQFCRNAKRNAVSFPESEWDSAFSVTWSDCKLFLKHEKDMIQKQRMRMYGVLDN